MIISIQKSVALSTNFLLKNGMIYQRIFPRITKSIALILIKSLTSLIFHFPLSTHSYSTHTTLIRVKKKVKNKSILMNKNLRIFEVAPAVRRENSQIFGLKRGLFFTS
ncbi:MAG: hypothetical protein C5B43_00030, partial [Verrucomicrobia bacterium]